MRNIIENLARKHKLNNEAVAVLARRKVRIIATAFCVWLGIFLLMYFNDPAGIIEISVFFAVMGTIVVWQYILLIRDRCGLYSLGRKTEGRIKSVEKDKAVVFFRGLIAFYEFKDDNGKLISANMPLDKDYMKNRHLNNGDVVDIIYNPEKSSESEIYFDEADRLYNIRLQ